jgi:hypothetical protein
MWFHNFTEIRCGGYLILSTFGVSVKIQDFNEIWVKKQKVYHQYYNMCSIATLVWIKSSSQFDYKYYNMK